MPLIPKNACAKRHYPAIRGSELMCNFHPTIVELIPGFDCGLMQHAMSDWESWKRTFTHLTSHESRKQMQISRKSHTTSIVFFNLQVMTYQSVSNVENEPRTYDDRCWSAATGLCMHGRICGSVSRIIGASVRCWQPAPAGHVPCAKLNWGASDWEHGRNRNGRAHPVSFIGMPKRSAGPGWDVLLPNGTFGDSACKVLAHFHVRPAPSVFGARYLLTNLNEVQAATQFTTPTGSPGISRCRNGGQMDPHEVKKCLPVQYPVAVDEGGRDLSSRRSRSKSPSDGKYEVLGVRQSVAHKSCIRQKTGFKRSKSVNKHQVVWSKEGYVTVTGDTCGLLPPITFDLASSVTWLQQLAFHAAATWTKVAAVDPVAGQFTVKPVVTVNRINSITQQLAQHGLRSPTGRIVNHLTPVAPGFESSPPLFLFICTRSQQGWPYKGLLTFTSRPSLEGVLSFEIGRTLEVINIIYHYSLLSVCEPRPDSWSKDIVGYHLCLMYDQQLLALAEGIFRVDPDEEQLGFKLIVMATGTGQLRISAPELRQA
ncbi:hypothetical protein B0H14DRAFT_2614030 [Mycena olivaceomarginata]|nr:hypothetical protein B0H14DRAFT_2614030 [Mycena olivaceomarginata]